VSDHGSVRVVVVDDQALVRMGLRTLLGSEDGLELVGEAADGVDALALLRETVPDVALLDIGLPLMDGYEVARQIAAASPGRRPRLVSVTGYGQAADRERSRAAGFDAHVTKPADLQELLRLIDDLLQRPPG